MDEDLFSALESIQKPKCPKRNPSRCGTVDAVGSDVGILFALELFVRLVLATYFNDGVTVDEEVASFSKIRIGSINVFFKIQI